jgi:hypothetical protein
MFTIEHNNHKLQIYRTAEELPIKRYARFQRYCIMDSGIGSDLISVGGHFSKLFELLTYELSKEALQEAKNMYYNFHLLFEEIPLRGLAFVCLIHSIDDELVTDISEDNLKAVLNRLDEYGFTAQVVNEQIDEVKKKVHSDLKRYAPSFFNSEDSIDFYSKIKDKITAFEIYFFKNDESKLFEVNRYFAEYTKPQNFDSDSEENAMVRVDTTFSNLCAVLEGNGVANAAELSTLQFYLRLEYFKKLQLPKSSPAPKEAEAEQK